ncbi:hypothetical protein [Candidatus Paracaedibacter symbiosus]|uniref:hypothetical protein n=1 Tax=Candidatus Paracaedibacter symbiosus TaxID=244582 RepID=UPI0005095933|nr:hypothetical protein [Candidatus Paracaedibacter symbiosus]
MNKKLLAGILLIVFLGGNIAYASVNRIEKQVTNLESYLDKVEKKSPDKLRHKQEVKMKKQIARLQVKLDKEKISKANKGGKEDAEIAKLEGKLKVMQDKLAKTEIAQKEIELKK